MSSVHSASVNSVAWAPHEVGCLLAAASSDGTVSLLELNSASGQGQQQQAFLPIGQVQAHPLGANSVSWAPGAAAGALTTAGGGNTQAAKRFVSGGSEGLVKIWEVSPTGEITSVSELAGHADWVRDVAWSSTVLKKSYIASASQDKTVRIWSSENGSMSNLYSSDCRH
jgi:protein transport protein SEC13